MDDEEETEPTYMSPEQADRILVALVALRADVAAEKPERKAGRIATTLVTQATRQCLLAMAQALAPMDNGDGLDEKHSEVAGFCWGTLLVLGPVFMRTLPAKYHK